MYLKGSCLVCLTNDYAPAKYKVSKHFFFYVMSFHEIFLRFSKSNNTSHLHKNPLYLSSISRNSVRAWIASSRISGCTKFVGLTTLRRSWVGIRDSRTSLKMSEHSSTELGKSSSALALTQAAAALNISTSVAQKESLLEKRNKLEKCYFVTKVVLTYCEKTLF